MSREDLIQFARRDWAVAEAKVGFTLRFEGTPAFLAQTRVVPLLFRNSGWALDIVLGGPGLEEDFVRRAVRVPLAPGLTVPMIAAEDLIVTKVLAGRPKDIDDVRLSGDEMSGILASTPT